MTITIDGIVICLKRKRLGAARHLSIVKVAKIVGIVRTAIIVSTVRIVPLAKDVINAGTVSLVLIVLIVTIVKSLLRIKIKVIKLDQI